MIKLNFRWKKGGHSLVGSASIPDVHCAVSHLQRGRLNNVAEPSSVGFVKELSLIVSPFFFLFTSSSSSSFLCLPSPPLHLQVRCHPLLLSVIRSTPQPASPPPTQFPWRGGGGGLCCGRPVYAIPLVLKWQAGDRYAILKRGLMNFWHLISCFPVNISWLAGAWSAPPGPLWSAG